MKRLALPVALILAACSSAAEPVADGPRLRAGRAFSFRDDPSPGRGAAFRPDGRMLASASASGLVVLRDLPSLEVVRRLRHPGGATGIAFSPDGQWLATSGYDGIARLWNAATGRPARTFRGAKGTLWSLAFSPDGDRLAAAGEYGTVRVWSLADGRLLHALTGHGRNVWEVRFSSDGRRLASGSFDSTVRVWDADTGKALSRLTEHDQAVVGLAWSGNGSRLATGGDDSVIYLRRAADGRPIRRLAAGNHVYDLAFSPDDRWLASAGRARSGFGTLWHGLAGGGGAGEPVRLWRTADGALVAVLKLSEDAMHVGFSPGGRWLAASSDDGRVTLWRLDVVTS